MLSPEFVNELRASWLPNMSPQGLDRLIDLLEKGSPFLIHGCFTRAVPMGCLASHVAWNHPETEQLNQEAGITWLHRVACLNPATSHVIREWDRRGPKDWEMRAELSSLLKDYRQSCQAKTRQSRHVPELVHA